MHNSKGGKARSLTLAIATLTSIEDYSATLIDFGDENAMRDLTQVLAYNLSLRSGYAAE